MLNLLINSLMKKQLFLVVVAALAMASCSKDESTGINNGNAIDFRAAMQTRASETTMANITNFFVTALDKNNANYFSDAEFTKVALSSLLLRPTIGPATAATFRSSLTLLRLRTWMLP